MRSLATAACLVLAMALPASAQEIDKDLALLTVTGSGDVAVEPDLVLINLGVTARGKTAREALTANNESMDKVIAAILAGGVEERDISTSNLSINPVYGDVRPMPDGTIPQPQSPQIVAYEVNNQVRLRLRDVDGVGPLLDGLVTAGANQVYGITFDVDEPEKLQDDATKAAIADARRKAELLASAAGVKLVRIMRIDVGSTGAPKFEMQAAFARDAGGPPIMNGEHTIGASATLIYEIAPQ